MTGPRGDETGIWECSRCFDIGFRYETVDGREFVRPCNCRKRYEGGSSHDPLGACCIPAMYRECTLGNFVPRTEGLKEAYEKTLAYCDQFPHKGPRRGLGLLFWGATGTGKTHLAVAVLRELVANGEVSGRFWDFAALLKEISRSYNKASQTTEIEKSPLQSTLTVDLLLLDDLASRRMPDWANDTLFYIINARHAERRPTLITTVYEDVDREVAAGAHSLRRDEYLIERIGERTRSRLLEMCLRIPMQGPREREAPGRPQPTTLTRLRREKGSRDA